MAADSTLPFPSAHVHNASIPPLAANSPRFVSRLSSKFDKIISLASASCENSLSSSSGKFTAPTNKDTDSKAHKAFAAFCAGYAAAATSDPIRLSNPLKNCTSFPTHPFSRNNDCANAFPLIKLLHNSKQSCTTIPPSKPFETLSPAKPASSPDDSARMISNATSNIPSNATNF